MDLSFVRYIEWFDGPILTVKKDSEGNLYLEKWAQTKGKEENTQIVSLVARTTESRIAEYEGGRLSMLDLLKADNDQGWIQTASVTEDVFEPCVISQAPPSYLPSPEAMYDSELSVPLTRCPDCDSQLQTKIVSYTFAYGVDGPDQVQLPVTHPVIYCGTPGCGSEWTDWRGEEARTAAVLAHRRSLRRGRKS